MAHTYCSSLHHIVFSTKNRAPLITPELPDALFAYIGGIARHLDARALIVGGHVDHVHILVSFPTKLSISDFVRIVKTNTSKWMRETHHQEFAWQGGYSAFSVSFSNLEHVRLYIGNQERHHSKMTFKEELVAFLKKHHIEYDERFIFD